MKLPRKSGDAQRFAAVPSNLSKAYSAATGRTRGLPDR